MDKIVGIVSKATQTRSRNDDDFTDRLSSRYTVVLLAAFAVLVGFTQVSCCSWLAVWFSGDALASINVVALLQTRLVGLP